MEVNTIIDDSHTSADLWEDWSVTNLQQSEWAGDNQTFIDESELKKEDFENSLRKVASKIKK